MEGIKDIRDREEDKGSRETEKKRGGPGREGEPGVYTAAVYLRLSREDGDICDDSRKAESNSITNQKRLIRDFLKGREEIRIYKEYVDDGYTGSDFRRPAFREMIEDMEAGKVNLIIVKDLSRFGREYIEAGRYLQKIFPAAGVRFIAVTDHYDSLGAGRTERNIVLPVKNFVNDAYSADLSVKIKSHLESKRENGEYTGAYVSYGFLKDGKDHNKLVADPVAGQNVKRIFCWKMEGMSNGRIAEKLNALGIPAPADYKRSLGIRYKSGFQKNFYSRWSPAAVGRILNNPLCKGIVVQGKQERINHKIKKMAARPEREQSRFRQADLVLIEERQFETVQGLLEKDTRVPRGRDWAYLFSGLLFCPDCGRQMIRRKVSRKGGQTVFYICKTYNVKKSCTRHSIKEQELFCLVREAIGMQVKTAADDGEIRQAAGEAVRRFGRVPGRDSGLAEERAGWGQKDARLEKEDMPQGFTLDGKGCGEEWTVQESGKEKIPSAGDGMTGQLEKELEESGRILSRLDMDRDEGILSEEEYEEIKDFYMARREELKCQIEARKGMAVKFRDTARAAGQWLERMAQPGHNILNGDGNFARGLLVTLMEKIWVYEGKRVEIMFRYRDGIS